MQMATHVPFCSPRIAERFQEAAEVFRVATHDSRAANAVLDLLYHAESDKIYAGNRNKCVEQLAKDVEVCIGCPANLMFHSPGVLHNALHDLMDSYCDAMDGIYYLH